MKKFSLLTTLLLFALLASAQYMPGTPRKKYLRPKKDEECQYVLNVTKNTDEDAEVDACVTRVAYRPYAELLTEIDALRKMNNWADTTYQRRFSQLPPGGQLVVTMYRRGGANADPAYLSVVGKDKDGKEIFNVPALPKGQGRFWNRDLYVSKRAIPFVRTETPQDVALFINDIKTKQMFEYIIKTQ